MKKLLCVFLFAFLFVFTSLMNSYASIYNFEEKGNSYSNQILKEYVKKDFEDFRGDVISYFYDMDNDGNNEIIGIIKSNLFYNLDGYELIILKSKDDLWHNINTSIYFDISKKFSIDGNRVTYYKSSLNNKKEYENRISGKLSTSFNYSTHNKNAKNSHQVIEGISGREYEASSFIGSSQEPFILKYVEPSEKTKYYLEIK